MPASCSSLGGFSVSQCLGMIPFPGKDDVGSVADVNCYSIMHYSITLPAPVAGRLTVIGIILQWLVGIFNKIWPATPRAGRQMPLELRFSNFLLAPSGRHTNIELLFKEIQLPEKTHDHTFAKARLELGNSCCLPQSRSSKTIPIRGIILVPLEMAPGPNPSRPLVLSPPTTPARLWS